MENDKRPPVADDSAPVPPASTTEAISPAVLPLTLLPAIRPPATAESTCRRWSRRFDSFAPATRYALLFWASILAVLTGVFLGFVVGLAIACR